MKLFINIFMIKIDSNGKVKKNYEDFRMYLPRKHK